MEQRIGQKEQPYRAPRAQKEAAKEPRLRNSLQQQPKMAPSGEQQTADTHIKGTGEGKRQGNLQVSNGPEGWNRAGSGDSSRGESLNKPQEPAAKAVTAPKMVPSPGAGETPIQTGETNRERAPPPVPGSSASLQCEAENEKSIAQEERSEKRGEGQAKSHRAKMGYPRQYVRSKSLPPHLGLQKVEIKDHYGCSQSLSCEKYETRGPQQESNRATHPIILQADAERDLVSGGQVEASRDLTRKVTTKTTKTSKKIKGYGHNLQRKEIQENRKQAQGAAHNKAIGPQSSKKSFAVPRFVKIFQCSGFTLPSSYGTLSPRSKNSVVKKARMTDQKRKRGRRSESQNYSSSLIQAWNNTSGTCHPLRSHFKFLNTGIETNESLLFCMDVPKSRQGHNLALGQSPTTVDIIAGTEANSELYQGTRPPEMSWPHREEVNPPDIYGGCTNYREARQEKALWWLLKL